MSGLQSNPSGYSDKLTELRGIFSRKQAPPLASIRFPARDSYGNSHFLGPLLHSSERQIEGHKYFFIIYFCQAAFTLTGHSFLTITHISTLPNTAFTRTHAHTWTWRNPTHTRVPTFTFAHMHLHMNTQCILLQRRAHTSTCSVCTDDSIHKYTYSLTSKDVKTHTGTQA